MIIFVRLVCDMCFGLSDCPCLLDLVSSCEAFDGDIDYAFDMELEIDRLAS